jgi:hypothetical protein
MSNVATFLGKFISIGVSVWAVLVLLMFCLGRQNRAVRAVAAIRWNYQFVNERLIAIRNWFNILSLGANALRKRANHHAASSGWWLPFRWALVLVALGFWATATILSFKVDAQSFADLGWNDRSELAAMLFAIFKLIAGFFVVEAAVPSIGVLPVQSARSRGLLGTFGFVLCIGVVVGQVQLGSTRAELRVLRERAVVTAEYKQTILALRESNPDQKTLREQTELLVDRRDQQLADIRRRSGMNRWIEPAIGIAASSIEVLTAWSLFALVGLILLPFATILQWSLRPPLAVTSSMMRLWEWLNSTLLMAAEKPNPQLTTIPVAPTNAAAPNASVDSEPTFTSTTNEITASRFARSSTSTHVPSGADESNAVATPAF